MRRLRGWNLAGKCLLKQIGHIDEFRLNASEKQLRVLASRQNRRMSQSSQLFTTHIVAEHSDIQLHEQEEVHLIPVV